MNLLISLPNCPNDEISLFSVENIGSFLQKLQQLDRSIFENILNSFSNLDDIYLPYFQTMNSVRTLSCPKKFIIVKCASPLS